MTERKEVRFSNLKHIGASAAHYRYHLEHDLGAKRATTVGTIAHSMVLGGVEPVVYRGQDGKRPVRRGKAYEAFCAEHPGKVPLLPSEYDAAAGIARSLERHQIAMSLLEGERETELPHWWFGMRKCGGRPDVVNRDRFVTELKTGVTSDPSRFPRLGLRMAYHGQLSWYLDGNEARGGTAKDAFIVAVEQTPPYVVTPFKLTERALEFGRKLCSIWMNELLVCEEADQWPGYTLGTADFDCPEPDLEFTFADGPDDGQPEDFVEEVA